MILYNKYKLGSFLNLEEAFEINVDLKMNALKVNHLFKFSKKLMRSFLLLHFYVYTTHPFSGFTYKNVAKYFLKLDALILIFCDVDSYDNYFRFD